MVVVVVGVVGVVVVELFPFDRFAVFSEEDIEGDIECMRSRVFARFTSLLGLNACHLGVLTCSLVANACVLTFSLRTFFCFNSECHLAEGREPVSRWG